MQLCLNRAELIILLASVLGYSYLICTIAYLRGDRARRRKFRNLLEHTGSRFARDV